MAAFNGLSQNSINADKLSEEWALLDTQNGVEFYIKKAECKRQYMEKELIYTFILMKNTTNESKNIEFQLAHEYSDRCAGCELSPDYQHTVTVAANSSLENDCTFKNSELSMLIDNPNLHHINTPLILKSVKLFRSSKAVCKR